MGSTYLVCATPRSGSTLLCEALKATGVAGRPEEYFEAVVATGRPPRPEDYLDGLDDAEALGLLGGARRRSRRRTHRWTASRPTASTSTACAGGARPRTASSAPS